MKKNITYILALVGIVILSAGLTFTALRIFIHRSEPAATPSIVSLPTLGEAMKTSLKDPTEATVTTYVSNRAAAVIHLLGSQMWVSVSDGSPVVQLTSKRNDGAASTRDLAAVVDMLKARGYKEEALTSSATTQNKTGESSLQSFASSDTVCNVRQLIEVTVYSLQVDCAHLLDFNKNSDALKPFVAVYGADSTSAKKDALFGAPSIQNSGTKNYKNARLLYALVNGIADGSEALFYQTPDANWHFFTVAPNVDAVPCSNYATTDQTNAFLGFSCWDTTTNKSSFVKASAPTFEVVPGSQSQN